MTDLNSYEESLAIDLAKAEFKLAKAVEALREIYGVGNATGCNPQWMTNTAAKALAELEGK